MKLTRTKVRSRALSSVGVVSVLVEQYLEADWIECLEIRDYRVLKVDAVKENSVVGSENGASGVGVKGDSLVPVDRAVARRFAVKVVLVHNVALEGVAEETPAQNTKPASKIAMSSAVMGSSTAASFVARKFVVQ
jgi:hypothetical protein